ncbi:MAG: hypothetical protein A4E57_03273 [Syntrophorhabdaceae bacterium PtaU1.Bin034]|nr:MAG: hypothetical protein A4E57_03273 [Syntrophorhabdaceae bacterium PtaU1.Bin034]
MSADRPTALARVRIPFWTIACFSILALIGIAAFVTGISGPDALRWWQAYLVNFLFWSGLSSGQACFLAVMNMAEAQWARPLKRLSEALGACLPVVLVLFGVLHFGKGYLFPWILHPVPGKEAWLNWPFLFARDGGGLLLLSLLSLGMICSSVKSDYQWSKENGAGSIIREQKVLRSWERSWRMQKVLSPMIAIAYAFVLSLLGFDLVMSLDPHWYSTLFGGYFFVGSFYTGIAGLSLLALLTKNVEAFRGRFEPHHFHDIGKLLLAFCLFTGYLFYAQFLVIWYANIPEETRYVILRVKLTPWEPLAWMVLFMIFVVPLATLLSRKVKLLRVPMAFLSLLILAGLWLERFILVAPSLWTQDTIPLGLTELLVTAGFVGIVGLSGSAFLRMVPALPVSDPLFIKAVESPARRLAP